MRAIYWVYSVTKVYFFEKKQVLDEDEEAKRGIPEVNEDDQGEDSMMAGLIRQDEEEVPVDTTMIEEERYLSEHPEERVFK